MTPRTIFILAWFVFWCALMVNWCIERAPENNLSGVVESRNETASPRLPESGRIARRRMDDVSLPKNPIVNRQSERSASPAQTIDADAQRVINELVESGMTPEEATARYRHGMDWATTQRVIRAAPPGLRTNIDAGKWPLFEDEP